MKVAASKLRRTCGVCGLQKPDREMMACDVVRSSIADELDSSRPLWRQTGWICHDDVKEYRRRSVEAMIIRERGELTELDREVIDSLASHETVTENTEESYEEAETFGDRVADEMAAFAGSWTFILSFLAVLVIWVVLNALPVLVRTFDPYPFILLNLFLSMIAAFQAPLIMMSQRRQEEKDRLRSQNDYQINLKAEFEIRHLHEKMDNLLTAQWERLAKIEQSHTDLLGSIESGRSGTAASDAE